MSGRQLTPEQEDTLLSLLDSEEEVPKRETFVNRAVNAIPLGNLTTNAALALLNRDRGERARLTPEAKQELVDANLPLPEESQDPSLLETYRAIRDARRTRTAAGSAQHPWTGRAGTALGVGASVLAPLPGVSFAAKVAPGAQAATRGAQFLARLKSGAATGSAYGALGGATDGEADTTDGDWAGTVKDTALGALTGAGLGTVGATVAEGLSRAAPLLRRLALDSGRNVINNRADLATRTKVPLSDDAVEEALRRDMFRPEGALPIPPTTPQVYQRLDKAASEEGAQLGQIIDDLEAAGVKGPVAKQLADKLMERHQEVYNNSSASKTRANQYAKEADNALALADPKSGRLGLRQNEEIKRDLQNLARLKKLKLSPKETALADSASIHRQGTEDAIRDAAYNAPVGSPIHPLSQAFVPQKQVVGRLLEGRDAAEAGAAGALGRQPIGIKDAILGAATGDPVSAALTAFAAAGVRNRAPSLVARESYALANALAGPGAARATGQAGEWAANQGAASARDWADETFDDPESPAFKRLLASLLRR